MTRHLLPALEFFALFFLLSFVTGLLITLVVSLLFGRPADDLFPLDLVKADAAIAAMVGGFVAAERYRKGDV